MVFASRWIKGAVAIVELIYLEYARFYLITFAAIILFIHIIIPVFFSVIPYKKNIGNPSWALKSRIWTRVLFFFLAAYNSLLLFLRLYTSFPILGSSMSSLVIRNLSFPIYISILVFILYTWKSHPDGIKGL